MGLCTGTSKPKLSFWTSRHWKPLIDVLSKLSRNSSKKTSGSSGLQIDNNQSMVRVALTPSPKDRERMANPRITKLNHQQRRVMRSRRTLENSASSTKSLGTILMNVVPNSCCWLRQNPQGQMLNQMPIQI
jgi:hypothetical protein